MLAPNVLYGAIQGAAIPVIPLAAVSLTGSSAMAAIVAAMLTVGQLPVALPSGWIVARFGERSAMLLATAAIALGGLGAYSASALGVLAASVFLIGSGAAVFTMARHSWITAAVPIRARGRSLATLGGAMRLGMFGGPFLVAGVLRLTGDVRHGFLVIVAISGALAVLVACVPLRRMEGAVGPEPGPTVLRTMWRRRDVLLTLGLTISVLSMMRYTRRILVPLVGSAVGFDDMTVALVMGFASGIDFSLFYVGGAVADRWGRLLVAVPALAAFGLAHLAFGMATQLPAAHWWYLGGTLVMALANGWSGGVVATVGSDLADPHSPAPFLSSWRLTTELGSSTAPLAVAALAGASSLLTACVALALLAGTGAALLPAQLRRYLPEGHHGTPRQDLIG